MCLRFGPDGFQPCQFKQQQAERPLVVEACCNILTQTGESITPPDTDRHPERLEANMVFCDTVYYFQQSWLPSTSFLFVPNRSQSPADVRHNQNSLLEDIGQGNAVQTAAPNFDALSIVRQG